MKKIPLLFIILLLSALKNEVYAYPALTANFHKLTIQNGLADNMVFCIHKDKKGLMWFGTGTGLSKYDGNRFTNYSIGKEHTINVTKIEEGNRSVLFLLTNDWLTSFDCKTEQAVKLPVILDNKAYQVTDFLLSDDSTLFACNRNSLVRLKITGSHTISSLAPADVYPVVLKETERLMKLGKAGKRHLFLVTNNGRILLFHIPTGQVVKEQRLPVGKQEFSPSSLLYRNGHLYITTMSYGIFILDDSLTLTGHLTNRSPLAPCILSHNDVYSITPIAGNAYLATTWYGYTILRPDAGKPDKWSTEIYADVPDWQTHNIEVRMISSYFDPAGILWIGTHGGGIIVSDWRWNFFKQYNQHCDNETESIAADAQGRIYIATYNQGIMRSKQPFPTSGSPLGFETLPLPETGTALCIIKDKDNRLWFGYRNGTLLRYEPAGEKHTICRPAHGSAAVQALFIDSRQRFWVGTENGLFLLDRNTLQTKEIFLNQEINSVLDIDEDQEGNLWIATSLGLLKIKQENHRWRIRRIETETLANTAQTVLAAGNRYVYVGYKNGLGIVAPGQLVLSRFLTTRDGLSSNWINCLQEDERGYIWIGGNSGITCYDPRQKQCYNYYISGSNRTVSLLNGLLFWGGSKHLTYFNPEQAISAFECDKTNRVLITRLEVNDEPVTIGEAIRKQIILKQAIEYTGQIALSHANRNFSLSLSNPLYSGGIQKYSYRLLPYQTNWAACNDKKRISYSDLPAGTYTFQVKSISPDNTGSEITSLDITILPHWTHTRLFYFCLFLSGAGVTYGLIRTIRKRRKHKKQVIRLEHALVRVDEIHRQEKEEFFARDGHKPHTSLTLAAPVNEEKPHFTSEPDNPGKAEYKTAETLPDAPAPNQEKDVQRRVRPCLLVIEDNTEIRTYVTGLFEKEYRIYEVADGEEGVKTAGTYLPDLILWSIMTPLKNEFECCRKIRNKPHTAHIPIIMLTAKIEDADIIRATRIGIDDHLTKPFNPDVLKAKVENLLLQRARLKRIYTRSLLLKTDSEEQKQPEQDSFMQRVINVIESHLTDDSFNVKFLASALNVSQPTLYRKIKHNTRLSVIEVIRNVRMSKAAFLLLHQKYPVQTIAEMVGYNDYDTFRIHFTRQFGVPPSRYSKNSAGDNPGPSSTE